jgi:hypothetical protein
VRVFFVETILPLVTVLAAIAGLTYAVFEVPNAPPPARPAPAPTIEHTPARIPDTPSKPLVTAAPRREQINDVLARAVRTLADTPPPLPSAVAPLGATESPPDSKVFGVVSKLGEAMRLARDARDDKDLLRAEELMRSARQEMDVACDKGGGSGPLCQSAEQIRSLGY